MIKIAKRSHCISGTRGGIVKNHDFSNNCYIVCQLNEMWDTHIFHKESLYREPVCRQPEYLRA